MELNMELTWKARPKDLLTSEYDDVIIRHQDD